jgi:glycosyltransferase involved in cell wall biosynthesis
MKVHVYGNTLNSAYHLTKILRDKGIDAEMFLDNTSGAQQDYPWWDDHSLNENNLPDWVHYYQTFPLFLLPNKQTRQMIRDFSACDIALVSCYGPILAMKANVPFVFYSLGSDLNMISLKKDFQVALHNSSSIKDKCRKIIKILTFSPLQRLAIKKHASRIVIYMGYQYKPFISSFQLEHKTLKLCYPKDVLNYKVDMDADLNEKYKEYKIVFFMLSRHSWASAWNEYKGNDKFLKAYAKFIKERQPKVLLISANKGIDIDKSKKIIQTEGIEKYVEWVEDMPKYVLKKYQSLPNVVMVDNFWHDSWYIQFPEDKNAPKVGFGFGCIESLAAKRPLITAFKDQDFYNNEQPPIFDAFTEEEIYGRLNEVYDSSQEELAEAGQKGYDFAVKWHEQTLVIDTHINVLKDAFADLQQKKTNPPE